MKFKTTPKVIFVLICCTIIISSFSIGLFETNNDVNAAEVPELVSGYYYIKNVRSGKYLTLQGNISDVGTQVIQYTYTGGNNQKWVFEYSQTGAFGGFYRNIDK